jgi:formate dehydrogenase
MLRVIIDEHLIATSFVNKHTTGLADLVRGVQQIDLQTCVERCGVADDTIRDLARELAARPSGFVYGRTGTCTQRFGTLNNLLQDVLNIVTGNIERPGGWVFGWAPIDFIDFAEKAGLLTYGTRRSRVLGLPEVNGQFPSTALAPDIVTPGEGRIRALVTVGGNPVLSSAAGAQIASALSELDLHFSLDLYVNETNKHADYVLPVTTFFEREDVPLLTLPNMLRPMMIATEAVAEPLGDVRQEWEILDEIARRMGRGGALSSRWLRRLARVGLRLTPRRMIDMLVRTSAVGDRFGLRPSGLSLKKLAREHPHGMLLREDLPIEPLASRLRTPDKRIPLAAPALLEELGRFLQHRDDDSYPLRLIGMRELRSQNTWMHNVERLVPASRRQHALVNPRDAAEVGIADGDVARIVSAHGSAVLRISVTEDMTPSTVAVPHGWGHDAGWHRANAAGGANSNDLASSEISDIERLAGMSILNGIPVRLLPAGHEGASGIDSDRAR